MSDLFGALTTGIRFNKNKHAKELQLFNGQTKDDQSQDNRKRTRLSFLEDEEEEEETPAVVPVIESKSAKKKGKKNTPETDEDINRFESQEDINAFRNRLQIKVKGKDVSAPCATFQEMPINGSIKSILLKNIEESKWKEPTPIQMQAIPVLLEGRDLLASAPTGSGKTGAFVIPILSRLQDKKNSEGIHAVLLAPTKELAGQIHREAMRLSTGKKLKICLLKQSIAATALASHSKTTLEKFDLIISTPMRLLTLIRANVIDLSHVEMLVMDEVDKLFELDHSPSETEQNSKKSSFLSQVDEILHNCPDNIQCGLFSATISSSVQELSNTILRNPAQLTVGIENSGASTITQKLTFVGREEGKLLAIRQLIQKGIQPPVIIFLQSKDRAKELFRELVYDSINVDVIHSERTSQQRDEIIKRFRTGEIWVLICTDLMARGVDFKGVNLVINYDLPQSAVAYIHRIGRTGRAGKQGEAVTFFTEDDIALMRPIANVMKLSGCEVPEWLLNIKQMSSRKKKQLKHKAPERNSISTVTKFDKQKGKKLKQMKEGSKRKKQSNDGEDD